MHKGKYIPCRTGQSLLPTGQRNIDIFEQDNYQGIENIPPIKLQKQILYLPIRMYKMPQQTLCREIRNTQERENKQPPN